ncbi:MAG: hypothetical protein LBP76_02115, partial [Treponema sp.]|nr:hypothetical protein [Treponema sp.]
YVVVVEHAVGAFEYLIAVYDLRVVVEDHQGEIVALLGNVRRQDILVYTRPLIFAFKRVKVAMR